MATYKTPGVYVEEISTLPPSVAEVATAVPAFLGCSSAGLKLARVSTLLEFEEIFGGPKPTEFVAKTQKNAAGIEELKEISFKKDSGNPEFLLWYAVNHYFKNGGGPCYIVSIGDFSVTLGVDLFTKGLELLAKEDEPTLIVPTDAALLNTSNFSSVATAVLAQCATLKDRFAIFDVPEFGGDDDIGAFRDAVGANYLSYGAAYYPYLQTTLSFAYEETGVVVQEAEAEASNETPKTMADLKATQTALYNDIKSALGNVQVTLPPSAAIAGVYAQTDRDRGVWKAPANVSLASVVGPVIKITDEDQESLNIDATAGKSINAIRAFTGKGTLVWGARTLAGNDNEWRYVPVRRLFVTIEESTRKSSAFAVFEPNDTTTWLKVKSMIESYLYDLWQKGALSGSTPEAAYYVSVGLGKTMTSTDVLEGRMIVEIGVAAVRPAEFIVLRFSHYVQEA